MIKQFFQRAMKAFRTRRTYQLHELNDWVVALVGSVSFLIAGYWGMGVLKVLPEVISVIDQHGVTLLGAAILVFLGALGSGIWFFGCIAARCHALLFKRHFR